MPRLPRRLRNLNLAAESFVENCQQGEDSLQSASAEDLRNDQTHQESFHGQATEDDQLEEENPQGPPELDIAFADIGTGVKRSIKIIWANGAVQEVFKCLRADDLWKLNGGRVLVETDENGVPNQWSESMLAKYLAELAKNASFAPLHFKRWDDKLFKGPKKRIIIDVEEKFVYSSETKLNTQDWILKTVNKKWRDYKSELKKKYFHPNKKTLGQMEKVVPDGVNENQWSILLGIWSSEGHKKLCQKNAEAAKKLMHPHTTGRKSHPRLKKEMEDKNKGSVSRIDLWDEAHKKRNGDYVNDNVQRLMEKAYDELANRRMKNGSLSSKDHDDVFENVIRKELKVNEYYDDQYWSKESDSRARSEREKRYERELQIYKFRFDNLCAFIEGKYPGEDWRSSTLPAGYTMISDGDRIGANLDEHATSTRFNITIPSPTEYVEIHDDSNMNGERNSVDDYESNESNVAKKARAKKFIKATKDCSRAPSKSDKKAMKTQNGVTKQDKAQQMKKVILYLKNSTNDKEAVAIGNLISRDRTYVVGGSMLGDEYYCVVVHRLTDAAEDQILPRPYKKIQTLEDAIGYCIAWPSALVKRVRHNPRKHAREG